MLALALLAMVPALAPATAPDPVLPPAAARRAIRVVGPGGRPVGWARVRRQGGEWQPVDPRGRALVPRGRGPVVVAAAGHVSRRVSPRRQTVVLAARAVRAEQWGGGPRRAHFFPVAAGTVRGAPAWSMEFRELLEFPPAVSRERVVVHAHLGRLVGLDRRDGRVVWEKRLGYRAATTPAIGGDTVVAVSFDGQVGAYRTDDGGRRWHLRLGGDSETSPLVLGGRVVVADTTGAVLALGLHDGRVRWRADVGATVKASVASAAGRLVVADYGGCLTALRPGDGVRTWRRCWPGARFYATPSIGGGLVVAGSYDGWFHAVDLATGTPRWSFRSGPEARVTSAAAIAGDRAFVADDQGWLHALDLRTGLVRWRWRDPAAARISGAVSVAGRTVYVSRLWRQEERKLTTGIDMVTGRPRWHTGDGRYTPVVADSLGTLIIGHTRIRVWPAGRPLPAPAR
ncbi:MAG: PQQ-binding-like beta-propeller repeat protein [Thermoleophilia bacterium]|nr:PQQ-binding-like beta-propeller repeat protein [Thermoleophilia bacterium]